MAGLILETANGDAAPAQAPPADAPPTQPPAAPRLPRAADYDPGLAALYRCAVDLPARPTPTAPVLPEVVRFDPAADPARPGTVYGRLLDDLRSGRLAEVRRLHPPMTAPPSWLSSSCGSLWAAMKERSPLCMRGS